MTYETITIARWCVRVAYLSCLLVWLTAYSRRRIDLVLIAMFVHATSLVAQEQLLYTIGFNTAFVNSVSVADVVVFSANTLATTMQNFAISWGTSVIFVYSCGFVSITHERVVIAVTFIVILVLYVSDVPRTMLFGTRFCISATMVIFFLYQSLLRTVYTYINRSFALTGYILYYASFIASIVDDVSIDAISSLLQHGTWILLINFALTLILLSIPPARHFKIVHGALDANTAAAQSKSTRHWHTCTPGWLCSTPKYMYILASTSVKSWRRSLFYEIGLISKNPDTIGVIPVTARVVSADALVEHASLAPADIAPDASHASNGLMDVLMRISAASPAPSHTAPVAHILSPGHGPSMIHAAAKHGTLLQRLKTMPRHEQLDFMQRELARAGFS